MQRAHLSIEKRRNPRVMVTVPVRFKVINRPDERDKILAELGKAMSQTTNVSSGGIALNTHAKLQRGDLLKLDMELPNQHTQIRTFAEVMWIRPNEDIRELAEVGLQFLAVRNEDEDLISNFVLKMLRDGALPA
jgi:Tfp pilus assembly protein PilZ